MESVALSGVDVDANSAAWPVGSRCYEYMHEQAQWCFPDWAENGRASDLAWIEESLFFFASPRLSLLTPWC